MTSPWDTAEQNRRLRNNLPRYDKRQQAALYNKLRKRYLTEHPSCEVCIVKPATVIHHKKPRATHFTDINVFMACCVGCERKFHGR